MLKNRRIRRKIVKLYSLYTTTYKQPANRCYGNYGSRSCRIRDRRKVQMSPAGNGVRGAARDGRLDWSEVAAATRITRTFALNNP
jgi:hypothetical protein